jgi:SHS2 domain-containing protein
VSYRWLEHTSELELRIEAPSESGVFELAVCALGELVGGDLDSEGKREVGDGRVPVAHEVAVTAPDRAALLAAFLEELVYLIETEDLIPEAAEHVELVGGRVTATVCGRRGHPAHLVKGVTYHELTFARAEHGISATVVLDV